MSSSLFSCLLVFPVRILLTKLDVKNLYIISVLGHFIDRIHGQDISQIGQSIDRTYHRQDNPQIGHIIDRTIHRQDISDIISVLGHLIDRTFHGQDISQIGHLIGYIVRTFHRQDISQIRHFIYKTFHRKRLFFIDK